MEEETVYLTVEGDIIKEGDFIYHQYKNGMPNLKGFVYRNNKSYLKIKPTLVYNRYTEYWEKAQGIIGEEHYLKEGNVYYKETPL